MRTGSAWPAALAAFGGDPENIAAVARQRDEVLGYVELHIEQGPVLEAHGLPVGIVTAINGASRFSVTVAGAAGHAGTVPMLMRRDALAAASAMVLAIEEIGRATPDLVATVGALHVHPGAPNSIAGRAVFSLDIRAPEDALRRNAVAAVMAALHQIADHEALALRSIRRMKRRQAHVRCSYKASSHAPSRHAASRRSSAERGGARCHGRRGVMSGRHAVCAL